MSRLEYQLNLSLFSVIDSNEALLKLNRLTLRSLSALISWFRLCPITSNENHLNKSILELYLLSLIIVRPGKRIYDNHDILTASVTSDCDGANQSFPKVVTSSAPNSSSRVSFFSAPFQASSSTGVQYMLLASCSPGSYGRAM